MIFLFSKLPRDQRYAPLPGLPNDRDRDTLHYYIDTYPDTLTISKLDVDSAIHGAALKWKYSGSLQRMKFSFNLMLSLKESVSEEQEIKMKLTFSSNFAILLTVFLTKM